MNIKHGENIQLGNATLVWSDTEAGWAVPGCRTTKSKTEAANAVKVMAELMGGKK